MRVLAVVPHLATGTFLHQAGQILCSSIKLHTDYTGSKIHRNEMPNVYTKANRHILWTRGQEQTHSNHTGLHGSQIWAGISHLDAQVLELAALEFAFLQVPRRSRCCWDRTHKTTGFKGISLQTSTSTNLQEPSPEAFPFNKQRKTNPHPSCTAPGIRKLQGTQLWDNPKLWFGKSWLQWLS